ncbi:MAG: hypothetical protein KDK64_03960, partial [Chlamydiia bacterium]|nr:hypothetical protein [Chlamydiia bacterium]
AQFGLFASGALNFSHRRHFLNDQLVTTSSNIRHFHLRSQQPPVAAFELQISMPIKNSFVISKRLK